MEIYTYVYFGYGYCLYCNKCISMRHELNRLSQITMGLTNTYLHELIVMLRLFPNYDFIALSVKITGLNIETKIFSYSCIIGCFLIRRDNFYSQPTDITTTHIKLVIKSQKYNYDWLNDIFGIVQHDTIIASGNKIGSWNLTTFCNPYRIFPPPTNNFVHERTGGVLFISLNNNVIVSCCYGKLTTYFFELCFKIQNQQLKYRNIFADQYTQ